VAEVSGSQAAPLEGRHHRAASPDFDPHRRDLPSACLEVMRGAARVDGSGQAVYSRCQPGPAARPLRRRTPHVEATTDRDGSCREFRQKRRARGGGVGAGQRSLKLREKSKRIYGLARKKRQIRDRQGRIGPYGSDSWANGAVDRYFHFFPLLRDRRARARTHARKTENRTDGRTDTRIGCKTPQVVNMGCA